MKIKLLLLLILSGDIEVNPRPINIPVLGENIHKLESFNKRGLHFLHLNIDSIFPNSDEIRLLAINSNPHIISFSKTKLDGTILDEEIDINGYSVIQNDRNRNGGFRNF